VFENLFSKGGLSLERLRSFAEIVEAQGFTAAARGDPARQSQYSRQLRELEEFFGVELVTRGKGRFALTTAGRELHRLVRFHFASLEELRHTCAGRPVEISLGAGDSLLQWHVLPRLAQIRAKLPNVVWTLLNCQTEESISQLIDGRTDLGIISMDAVPKALRCAFIGTMEFALFVPRGTTHKAAATKLDRLSSRTPLAVLEGHGRLNEALEAIARKEGVALNIQLRCSSLPQVAVAVEELGFAALLPVLCSQRLCAAKVEMLSLPQLKDMSRPLSLAWNPRQIAIRPALRLAVRELPALLRLR
jgi:DNA-binding transcriptional LysR family regulator